jgi:hypothetical protein
VRRPHHPTWGRRESTEQRAAEREQIENRESRECSRARTWRRCETAA